MISRLPFPLHNLCRSQTRDNVISVNVSTRTIDKEVGKEKKNRRDAAEDLTDEYYVVSESDEERATPDKEPLLLMEFQLVINRTSALLVSKNQSPRFTVA